MSDLGNFGKNEGFFAQFYRHLIMVKNQAMAGDHLPTLF